MPSRLSERQVELYLRLLEVEAQVVQHLLQALAELAVLEEVPQQLARLLSLQVP